VLVDEIRSNADNGYRQLNDAAARITRLVRTFFCSAPPGTVGSAPSEVSLGEQALPPSRRTFSFRAVRASA
jgi:hypothetical protein